MSEASEQTALFKWAEYTLKPEIFDMMFAVPNGGSRNVIEATHLKAQGVKRGTPDILLLVPSKGFHGLAIELKVGKNKPSKEQQAFILSLCGFGYKAQCVWGWDNARQLIEDYLKG